MVKHVGLITRSTVRVVARIRFKKLLGIDRADTPDHAGREVLLDAVNRSRRRGAPEARFELLAVGAIVDPFAGGGDPLTGRNRWAWATTVTTSRCPRALARRTQKPFSKLW